MKAVVVVALMMLPAIALTLVQNRRVTGHWTELPYRLSQYQYGVPAALTFQHDPVPHRELTPQQQLEYQAQLAFRGSEKETITTFLLRLEYRVRFYRFFFLAPLYVAILFFFAAFRDSRFVWVAATLLLFALGINFFPAFQLHYLAGVTCLFVLIGVIGLQQLSRLPGGVEASRLLIALCAAQFVFWYGAHVFELPVAQYETWDAMNHQNPERRRAVAQQLSNIPGKLLVFVRYWPHHIFQDEWVYNAADIDASRVVWARDLGPEEDQKLRDYYADRAAWLLEPDAGPPRLTPLTEAQEK